MNSKLVFALMLLSAVALGCNLSSYFQTAPATNSNKAVVVTANANKTLIDRAADTVFGTEKTGIPQCDEVLAELEKPTENANENVVDRGKRELIKQGIYSQVRSASANSTVKEKAEIGKYCAQIAAQLKPSSAAPPANSPAKK